MSDNTPSTFDVKVRYVKALWPLGGARNKDLVRARAEFDRWLAEVKAEAAAEALNAAAQESYVRGDIGKEGGVEAWQWLRVRAVQAFDRP